jgi:hypothetical protein
MAIIAQFGLNCENKELTMPSFNVPAAAGTGANAASAAEWGTNTAESIALQDYATQLENAINNDMTKDQLAEAGPKNAKSLTQG